MAISPEFPTSNTYIKYKIAAYSRNVDVAGNFSTVDVSVECYRTNTGYTTYGTGTVYCKVNGVTYSKSITTSQKITSTHIYLFSKTGIQVPHNADGSKEIRVSAWIQHSQFTSSEHGIDLTLPDIPRQTTPVLSASSVNFGSSVTITLNRASDSFTHELSYSFGNLTNQTSGLSASSGVATSATFTPPLSLASQIPNATTGTGKITCKTYNGTTLLGTTTVPITFVVPSTVKPIFGATPITLTETVAGVASKFGALVQNISKPQIAVSVSGAYGATITAYKVTFDGQSATANNTTFEKIISSGSLTATAIVTDSRGRTNTATLTVTVLPYASPVISSFSVVRCASDGTEDPDGNRVKATFAFNISPVNNLNDKYYEVVYRETGTTQWGAITSGNLYTFNSSVVSGAYFDVDKTYDVAINIYDYLSSNSASTIISTAFTLFDCRSTGRGIAFGKVSQKDAMEVALDLDLTGKFIQESVQTPTLLNSWVNYAAGYAPVGYWKDKCGVVHLQGMIKSGATAAETVIFNLPTGYRPAASEKFFTVSVNNICVIDVYSSGNVAIKAGANAGWVSLSGITFRAN